MRGLASRSLGKVACPDEVFVEPVEWASPCPRTVARPVEVAPLWIGHGSHHLRVLPSTTTIGIFGSGPWAGSRGRGVPGAGCRGRVGVNPIWDRETGAGVVNLNGLQVPTGGEGMCPVPGFGNPGLWMTRDSAL